MSAFAIDPVLSKMSAWQHELILRADMHKVPEVMRKSDWTCCVCGVRIPGYMQLHHSKGHRPGQPQHLKPICSFCHDMEHPLWAANRKRIVPVDAPDLTQAQISMIAWTVLSLTGGKMPFESDRALDEGVIRVGDNMAERREAISSMTGAKDADAVLQGAITVNAQLSKDAPGRKAFAKIMGRVRFAPSFLFAGYGLEAFQVWSAGGFREVPPESVLPDLASESHLLIEVGNKAGA